jgi:hypothetical protein
LQLGCGEEWPYIGQCVMGGTATKRIIEAGNNQGLLERSWLNWMEQLLVAKLANAPM